MQDRALTEKDGADEGDNEGDDDKKAIWGRVNSLLAILRARYRNHY